MKKIVLLLCIVFFAGCQKEKTVTQKPEKSQLTRDITQLKYFASSYQPKEINLAKNKDLQGFDMEYIFSDKSYPELKYLKDEIVTVILLKQYLYHIGNAHQGYDLLQMRKGQVKFLIDYYMKSYKIESDLEMLNSGYIYDQIISGNRTYNHEIMDLAGKINSEKTRVLKTLNQ
ncbi:MAG: hypothetical protein ACO1N9_11480 [Flavobacterium sp.]